MELLWIAIASAVGAVIGSGATSLVGHYLGLRNKASTEARAQLQSLHDMLRGFRVQVDDIIPRVNSFTTKDDAEQAGIDFPTTASVYSELRQVRTRALEIVAAALPYPAIGLAALEASDRLHCAYISGTCLLASGRQAHVSAEDRVQRFSEHVESTISSMAGPQEALALAQRWTHARLHEQRSAIGRISIEDLAAVIKPMITPSVNG